MGKPALTLVKGSAKKGAQWEDLFLTASTTSRFLFPWLAAMLLLAWALPWRVVLPSHFEETRVWACRDHDCGCSEEKCKVSCCCYPKKESASFDDQGPGLRDWCEVPYGDPALPPIQKGIQAPVPTVVQLLQPKSVDEPLLFNEPKPQPGFVDPPEKVPISGIA